LPKNRARAADTSSPAAARIPVVEGAAAAAAPLIASSIPVRFPAAAANASGAAITYDIDQMYELRSRLGRDRKFSPGNPARVPGTEALFGDAERGVHPGPHVLH